VITRQRIAEIDCMVAEPDDAPTQLETVVCLHGIGGDDASFAPQLESLSAYYRIVAWNMPGYRESAALDKVTFPQLADSLHALVSALDCGPVHIVGHSIGGMIAQEFYHRYYSQVASLMLVATTTAFGGKDDSFKKAFLQARLKPLDQGLSMRQIAANAIPSIVGSDVEQAVVQCAVESMAAIIPEVYREVLSCLVQFNRRQEWVETTCPVCVVAGSMDTNAPAATLLKMVEKLPHAKYHEIKDAGHLVNLENSAEFNAIAKTFLSANAHHALSKSVPAR